MRAATRALAAGLVIVGLLALTSGTALAGGGGNSAGNSQYVDPLSGNGHHSKGGSHSSSSSGSSTTSSSTSTSPGSSTLSTAAPSSVSTTSTSSSTATHASSKSLPFTGLNLWACVGVGVGLLAAGLGLRRVLARVY